MSSKPHSVSSLVALLLLCGPAAAQQLTAEEFTATHVGRCLAYVGPTSGTQCYGADGATSYDDATYGQDTGRWSLRGDEVCVRWSKERTLDCGPISRTPDGGFTDGSYRWTVD
jgi:hypothetical protein